MSRIVHFEIPADNLERAAGFYEKVFGWEFTKWEGSEPYWLAGTGPKDQPGIDGAIAPRKAPGQTVTNVIGVASIDASSAEIEKAGGRIVIPKFSIPKIGYAAYFVDTEGNTMGLIEPDESAK